MAVDVPDWTFSTQAGTSVLTAIATQILSVASASFIFSQIVGTYNHLFGFLMGVGDAVLNNVDVGIQFNGDSAANYEGALPTSINAGFTETAGLTSLTLASFPAGSGANPGVLAFFVPFYAKTTLRKAVFGTGISVTGITLNSFAFLRGGTWDNTAAITALTLIPASGNFIAGSACSLYGLT